MVGGSACGGRRRGEMEESISPIGGSFKWKFAGTVPHLTAGLATMAFECPDMFELDGKWIVTCSPMYHPGGIVRFTVWEPWILKHVVMKWRKSDVWIMVLIIMQHSPVGSLRKTHYDGLGRMAGTGCHGVQGRGHQEKKAGGVFWHFQGELH